MTLTVNRVISLGGSCTPAWRIRNHLSVDSAYPFDWWITGLFAVPGIVDRRFSNIFHDNNLEEIDFCGQGAVLSKLDGIVHMHDFHKSSDGKLDRNWRNHIPKVKEKFDYLGERFFKDCSDGETLFIRMINHIDMHHLELAEENIKKTVETVRKAINNEKAKFLFLNYEISDLHIPGVIFDRVDDDGENLHGFAGSTKGWNDLWERQKITVTSNNEGNINSNNMEPCYEP